MFFLIISIILLANSVFALSFFDRKDEPIIIFLQDGEEEQLCHCMRLFDSEQG